MSDFPKIAVLINTDDRGGAENVAVSISNYLLSQGWEVHFLAVESGNSNSKLELDDNCYLLKKQYTKSPIGKLFNLLKSAVTLKSRVRSLGIELVQSHTYRANCINILSKMLGSSHKVQIVNHSSFSRYSRNFAGSFFLKLIKKLYWRADSIVLISQAMRLDMLKHFSKKIASKVAIINNPYDIDDIVKRSDDNTIVAQNRIDDSHVKQLVFLGRLIPLKKVEDIIIAFSNLTRFQGYYDLRLVIIGDGFERSKLEMLVQKMDLNRKIEFLGLMSNPYPVLRMSDILILASETEGFPNALIEGLACNCGIISSDCVSGPREILAPTTDPANVTKDDIEIAEFGILYPVGNVKQLEKALKLLIDNERLFSSMIEKAKKRALNFDTSQIMPLYVNSIKVLLSTNNY